MEVNMAKKKKRKIALDDPVLPWDDLDDHITKSFLLRISQPNHVKIKVLARHLRYKSMHDFCWQIIEQFLEEEIERITNDENEMKELQKTVEKVDLSVL